MDVRLPDGRIVRNVPDGMTQEQLLARMGESQPRRNLLDTLDEIDAQEAQAPSAPQPSNRLAPNFDAQGLKQGLIRAGTRLLPGVAPAEALTSMDPTGQGTAYIAQQLKKGVAAGLGAPIDLTTALANLGISGYGVAKNVLTGSSDLPALITDPVGGSGTFERLFLTNDNIQPTGPVNRVVGRVVKDLGAASVPMSAAARYPTAFLPRGTSPVPLLQAQNAAPGPVLSIGTGLSALSSLGGEAAREIAPEPYKQAADMSGQLLAGVALPAMVLSRIDAVNQLRDATKDNNVNRAAGQFVENQIRSDVGNFPGARSNLAEALKLQDEIPGFQPRIGQASGVPSLLDMEHRVAISGPEQFNRRSLQDAANLQAIATEAGRRLPLLTNPDLGQRINVVQSERNKLAEALPEIAREGTGRALRDARTSLKARYDFQAAERFAAPVREAERQRVMIDPADLIEKSERLLSNPILKYEPHNAPGVVSRINALQAENRSNLVDESGKPILGSAMRIPFAELKGMREAVLQDIAHERTRPSPEARQRLRALHEMVESIDDVAARQAPPEIGKAWTQARDWYRDEYAPRFLRGLNFKQTQRDITGEMRIADESLPGQYFKKMAPTPMNRFLTLYGDSPQAMRAMDDHILDSYRREVVKDGVIDAKKHDVFMRNYEPALKQLPQMKENLSSMGGAARMLSEREAGLIEAQSVLSRAQLNQLRYDDPNIQGLDPRKINTYLTKQGAHLEQAISSTWGEKAAKDHMDNLRKIAKAAEIADRGGMGPGAQPSQSTNPLDLRKGFGFSGRTVFNMMRAVTTGRTSTHDMAYTLGAQAAGHRLGQALIKAEERAISDPMTARLIADSLSQQAMTQNGKGQLRKILERGGLYLLDSAVGTPRMQEMTRHRAAPFAIESIQQSIPEE